MDMQKAMVSQENALRNKKQSLDILERNGFTPDLIIDVGAAGGTEGLYETWPQCHVILIELLGHFEESLTELVANLNSAEQLTRAVGSRAGRVTYHYDKNHSHRVSFASEKPEGWMTENVEMITLDSLLQGNINAINASKILIKIDVDGPEIDVLKGASEMLKRECALIIETPLQDRKASRFTDIAIFMRESGYEIYDIIEPIYRPCDLALWQVDSIFMPSSHSSRSNTLYS